MTIPIGPDGHVIWGKRFCMPADLVVVRAVMDCIVVLSTYPQDMLPINGAACAPTERHYRVRD